MQASESETSRTTSSPHNNIDHPESFVPLIPNFRLYLFLLVTLIQLKQNSFKLCYLRLLNLASLSQKIYFLRLLNLRSLNHLQLILCDLPLLFRCLRKNQYIFVMSLDIVARMLQLPRLPTFNYKPRVHTNLRGINTICASYNVSFLLVCVCMFHKFLQMIIGIHHLYS